MHRSRTLLISITAIVAVAAGMLAARAFVDTSSQSPALAKATLLTPPRPLPEFELEDHAKAVFDRARLRDHWSLLFFGFTRCPDICPTTLGALAQVEKSLSDLPKDQRPQIVLISVDPRRDTPEQLASYVKFFSSSFLGVTGTQQATDALTLALGVPVAMHRDPNSVSEDDYTVDHSAAIFLVDPHGALRALFSTPHAPAVIAADYRRIVANG